ncbi:MULTISPECIES: hypothetical protein [unclassified Roseofilum]|uniref:hypothetical protein n=1 Tax=unclassified Roseofilum TaxID=2620099 RepID=UPI001B09C899|nr:MULTISPECIES: hypothetical protein [unclassified Roseofilum]MBP0011317.1 hypothetical protein [Roseofilum sp. Belize Diploria]MBP0035848.1 hypothetical protein [Roseofilum sp. Belize BBD 4]
MTVTNRWVVDTNVLVSALLFKSSVPFQAIAYQLKMGMGWGGIASSGGLIGVN